MFFVSELFVKKGSLGNIWLEGTMSRKLKKNQIMTSNVTLMCKSIHKPPVALALPTQSTLLRGVVRIHNRKAGYLLEDAHEAQSQMRVVSRAAVVSLPERKLISNYDAITFREDESVSVMIDLPDISSLDDLASIIDEEHEVVIPVDWSQYAPELALSQDITMTQPREVLPSFREELEMPLDLRIPGGELAPEEFALPEIDLGDLAGFVPPTPTSVSGLSFATSPFAGPSPIEMPPDLVSIASGISARTTESKRARARRAVDRVVELSDDEIRFQLTNTDDIVAPRPVAVEALGLPRAPHDELLMPHLLTTGLGLEAEKAVEAARASEVLAPELLDGFREQCVIQPAVEEARGVVSPEAPGLAGIAGVPPMAGMMSGFPEMEMPEFGEELSFADQLSFASRESLGLEVEVGRARRPSDLESVASRESFYLGMEMEEPESARKRRISRRESLLPLEEGPKRARVSPPPSEEYLAPDISVPPSQFVIPSEHELPERMARRRPKSKSAK